MPPDCPNTYSSRGTLYFWQQIGTVCRKRSRNLLRKAASVSARGPPPVCPVQSIRETRLQPCEWGTLPLRDRPPHRGTEAPHPKKSPPLRVPQPALHLAPREAAGREGRAGLHLTCAHKPALPPGYKQRESELGALGSGAESRSLRPAPRPERGPLGARPAPSSAVPGGGSSRDRATWLPPSASAAAAPSPPAQGARQAAAPGPPRCTLRQTFLSLARSLPCAPCLPLIQGFYGLSVQKMRLQFGIRQPL